MGDYHFTYKDVPGKTTQWDDIQRKLGNLPPLPEIKKPDPWAPTSEPSGKEVIDAQDSVTGLEELEDEFEDDRFLEEYRKKRMAELQAAASKPRFGTVKPIMGCDFVKEVSQMGDIWVVVHLYKNSIPACGILGSCLDDVASRHPDTKFVKIVSTECIPNYPDANVPTVLIYHKGDVVNTIVGLGAFGGSQASSANVEFVLSSAGLNFDGEAGQKGDKGAQAALERLAKEKLKEILEKMGDGRGQEDDDDGS
eukprot:jgi/Mesvir1/575/Mv02021-RA.1